MKFYTKAAVKERYSMSDSLVNKLIDNGTLDTHILKGEKGTQKEVISASTLRRFEIDRCEYSQTYFFDEDAKFLRIQPVLKEMGYKTVGDSGVGTRHIGKKYLEILQPLNVGSGEISHFIVRKEYAEKAIQARLESKKQQEENKKNNVNASAIYLFNSCAEYEKSRGLKHNSVWNARRNNKTLDEAIKKCEGSSHRGYLLDEEVVNMLDDFMIKTGKIRKSTEGTLYRTNSEEDKQERAIDALLNIASKLEKRLAQLEEKQED